MEVLSKQGWGISNDGFEYLKSVQDDEEENIPLYDVALDTDLSKITSAPITDEMKKNLQHPTPLILQVKSVKNVGAPSISQHNNSNPRFLQVILTDGRSSFQLVELRKTSKFTVETWPGTKVRLTGKLAQSGSYLEIDDSKIEILGGEVDALIEKWLVDKDSQNSEFRVKTFEQGGPPVFIPFEKRNAKQNRNKIGTEDLSGKKVFNKEEESDSEGEFEEQRAKDLAKIETARLKFATSRSLGVLPNNQRRDRESRYNRNSSSHHSSNTDSPAPTPAPTAFKKPEAPKSSYYKALPTASGLELDKAKVKLLVEMGFQQADCIQAMQEADNDMELALDGLQSLSLSAKSHSRDERPTRGKGGKRGRRGRNNYEEEEKARPQGSLMDFIGGDLPQSSTVSAPSPRVSESQENRQSYSRNNDRQGSRNDRGGHHRGNHQGNRRGGNRDHYHRADGGGHGENDHRRNETSSRGNHDRQGSRNDRCGPPRGRGRGSQSYHGDRDADHSSGRGRGGRGGASRGQSRGRGGGHRGGRGGGNRGGSRGRGSY